MVIAVLVILAVVALGGLATAVTMVVLCVRVIRRLSDQLVASSDYQIERIRVENGAEAVAQYARRARPQATNETFNGWVPPTEQPDMVIPNR